MEVIEILLCSSLLGSFEGQICATSCAALCRREYLRKRNEKLYFFYIFTAHEKRTQKIKIIIDDVAFSMKAKK
jgi:hypothetical protein